MKSPNPQGTPRKLSEVILEFAEEVAPIPGLPPSPVSVALAIAVWNCMFLPEREQEAELRAIALRLELVGPMVEANLLRLLGIRNERYRADRRFIGRYEYELAGRTPHLAVLSAWVAEGQTPPSLQ